MIILYASDTHVASGHLDRLFALAGKYRVDAVVVGGDIIPVRRKTIAEGIGPQRCWVQQDLLPRVASFRDRFPDTQLLLDFGNDDFMACRPLLEADEGRLFSLIHQRVARLSESVAVAGYMCVPPTPFRIKDWEKLDCADRSGINDTTRLLGSRTDTGEEAPFDLMTAGGSMEEDLCSLSESLESADWRKSAFIFVSHSPPLNTNLDCIAGGSHVGSLAVRRFIERWASTGRLLAAFHGHIHESPRVSGNVHDRVAGVPCFNAGQEPHSLRALLFDTEDVAGSARLIVGESEQRLQE